MALRVLQGALCRLQALRTEGYSADMITNTMLRKQTCNEASGGSGYPKRFIRDFGYFSLPIQDEGLRHGSWKWRLKQHDADVRQSCGKVEETTKLGGVMRLWVWVWVQGPTEDADPSTFTNSDGTNLKKILWGFRQLRVPYTLFWGPYDNPTF